MREKTGYNSEMRELERDVDGWQPPSMFQTATWQKEGN